MKNHEIEDLVVKGFIPYFIDIKNRSVNEFGDCVYNGPNGKHCFAGNFLYQKYKNCGKNLAINNEAYGQPVKKFFIKKFRKYPEQMWYAFQDVHDSYDNYPSMYENLVEICREYELDVPYIYSKFKELVPNFVKKVHGKVV